jgi:tetratricopeptide (TPR) repeat protein
MFYTLGIVFFLVQSLSPEAIEHAQAGSAAERDGRLDTAITEFRKVTELQPDMASGYANLGSVYFRKGDYAAAVPVLQHALQLSPNLNATHQILGVALLIQGDATGAVAHLEKSPIPELLGVAYLESGKLGNALTALDVARQHQPDDTDVLYYYGRATAMAAQQARERLAKADPAYTPATQGDPEPLEKARTALLEKPNDPQRLDSFASAAALASKKAFDRIIEIDAASARAHQVAAERFVGQNKIPEAEKEYAESLRLQPFTAGVHLAFGKVLAQAGESVRAMAEFRAECKIRPASAEAFYYSGSLLMQQGQPREALKELARADQLDTGKPAILRAIGEAATAAGDKDLAAQAHASLAAAYRSAGRMADADREMAESEKLKGSKQ